MTNPLIGTPLHMALVALQQAEKHVSYEFNKSADAAKRLGETNACIADAIDQLRRELNRQYAELKGKGAPVAPPPPKAAQPPVITLKMPGAMAPMTFPKTKRGLRELLDFTASALNDGGEGILLLNVAVFDRLAELGYAEEVEAMRSDARASLAAE